MRTPLSARAQAACPPPRSPQQVPETAPGKLLHVGAADPSLLQLEVLHATAE